MKRTMLWIVAVLLMAGAVIFQRTTGPTYPYTGSFQSGGEAYEFRLLRSEETTRQARIAIPDPGSASFGAQLHYKRFKTDDLLMVTPLQSEGDELAAYLPIQPAAGKMEYFLVLSSDGGATRIPATGEENIVLRYKDPVPIGILLPHIILMFFAVLIGMRAGLAALFDPRDMRPLAIIALVGMTVGGMILGPIVQKFAFGAYWTGFPFGGDLTDNKTLIMWLCWVAAVGLLGIKTPKTGVRARAAVVIAAVVMTVVYLIPHSLRGSELDYEEIDATSQIRQPDPSGRWSA